MRFDTGYTECYRSLPMCVHNPWFDERGHLDHHPSEYPEGSELPFYARPSSEDPSAVAHDFKEHVHRELEVTLNVLGSWDVMVGGESFTTYPGDMYIVNPFEKHSGVTFDSGYPKYCYTLMLDTRHFAKVLPADGQKLIADLERGVFRFGTLFRGRGDMLPVFERLHDVYTRDDSMGIVAAVFELLSVLSRECAAVRDGEAEPEREFVIRVSDIVEERFAEALTAASVSAELGYTESYFCRKFRVGFGTTFTERLNSVRIGRARSMTVAEHGSIAAIGMACGFSDYKYFAHVFRKYTGMSPGQYFGR